MKEIMEFLEAKDGIKKAKEVMNDYFKKQLAYFWM